MRVIRDTAYTAGLLHNLGTLGLMSAYPDEYSRMLEVSSDFGFDLLKIEQDLFDIDHCIAGMYLAQDWDFPDELAAAIGAHHDEPVTGSTGLDGLILTTLVGRPGGTHHGRWLGCRRLGRMGFS